MPDNILIDITVQPSQLDAQIKIMKMLVLLNEEPELREVLDTLQYLRKAADVKKELTVQQERDRDARKSREFYDMQRQQQQHQLDQNLRHSGKSYTSPWMQSTTTTTSVEDNRKITPFAIDDILGKFDPPF